MSNGSIAARVRNRTLSGVQILGRTLERAAEIFVSLIARNLRLARPRLSLEAGYSDPSGRYSCLLF